MSEEILFHIENRARDLHRSGLAHAEANRRARIEFGTVAGCKENCREALGWRMADEFRQEVRYAFRALAQRPGYAAITALSLALGIGVNVSSFISVNALVFHPLPYPDLEKIMTVWETAPRLATQRDLVTPANFFDLKNTSGAFNSFAAYRPEDLGLTGGSQPERVQSCLVSFGFFEVLGMKPVLGRTFLPEEEEPGRDAVVVVSQGFWKDRLGAASDAVGKTISLGGRTFTVAGVMPADFDFPLATELWIPLAFMPQEKSRRDVHSLHVIGRLKSGQSPAAANAEMNTLARRLEERYPKTNEGRGVTVTPVRELTNEVTDRFALILFGAAIFVLLLACANVANLQMARASGRQKEIGLRISLGASRFRIARQLIVESLLISCAGGAIGLLLASWNTDVTRARIPAQVLRWVAGFKNMRLDGGILLFTLLLSILVGLLCSLPSIIQLLGKRNTQELSGAMQQSGRGSVAPARRKLRGAIVITEVALAMVLLVGAGVMVTTFQRMLTFSQGFDAKNVLTLNVSLPQGNYRDPARIAGFYRQVLAALHTLPGSIGAGAYAGLGTAEVLDIEGRAKLLPSEPRPSVAAISADYLETMKIPILQGRPISIQDAAEAPSVVVLSESVARRYWPGANPIGRRIRFGRATSSWLTVIGVVGDTKAWFSQESEPAAYISYLQVPQRSMRLAVRTASDPMQSASAARLRIHAVDPDQPVYDVKSQEQILAEQTSGVRMAAEMMGGYAVIALILAATGIYSVSSFFVVQHTHEIGVRMALGAGRRAVLKMSLLQSIRLTGTGLVGGLALAFAMTRILSSLLYNVVVVSPMTFVGFTAILAASGALAGYIPALRAARIDPMVALRTE